jgi:FKBP-type peptidyl-prolyl cis-trans isomerase FkpA
MQKITMIVNKLIYKGFAILILFLVFTACGKDDPEKIAAKDREKILEYIDDHDIDATEHESGVFYQITREGTGGHPTINSIINISYKGYLLNGKVFDESSSWSTYLYNTILGWQVGIPLFKRGGAGILIVPSGLGYGEWPRTNIPANSVLVFEIELVDFN